MFHLLIGVATLSVISLGWAGESPAKRVITEADQGRTITCHPGERITVRVRNSATGGYNIVTPVFDTKVLRLRNTKELAPEPAPFLNLGNFGTIVFDFEAAGHGGTLLTINIARDW